MYIPHSNGGLSRLSPRSTTSIFTSPAWMAALLGLKSITQEHSRIQRRSIADSIDAVDLAICLVSVVGSAFIIIPYCIDKHNRKLRHSLILGLATSDLITSLIIVATSSVGLSGNSLDNTPRFCTFAGYAFATAIWTQHLWNISIAIITYMILVHPLSSFVSKVETHIVWLWPAFWALSLIVNGIGWIIAGFGNVGGYCGFRAAGGGRDFVPIFYFVPRAIVVLVVLVLYTHLFFFLRRVNLFNRANSQSRNRTTQLMSAQSQRDQRTQDRSMIGHGAAMTQQSDSIASLPVGDRLSTSGATSERPISSDGSSKLKIWNKWKRHSQSYTSPSGIGSSRATSQSTQGKTASSRSPNEDRLGLNTLEMVNYADVSPKTRPAEIDEETSMTNTAPAQGTANNAGVVSNSNLPEFVPVPIIRSPPLLGQEETRKTKASVSQTKDDEEAFHDDSSFEDEYDENGRKKRKGPELMGWHEAFQPMAPRRDVRDFGMTSPPQEHLKHVALSKAGVGLMKRQKEDEVADVPEKTSGKTDVTSTTGDSNYEAMLGNNWTWGMPVGGNAGGPSSSLPLTPSSPTSPTTKRLGGGSPRKERVGVTSTSSSSDEHGVESLGSTLNRQASILLLLYPAVYCCLFSVSIIRIIVDLTSVDGSPEAKIARQSNALHSISRWTIFAQGAIDALVFQFVERAFRARMKRQRRIAAGEDVPNWQTYYSIGWIAKLWRRRK